MRVLVIEDQQVSPTDLARTLEERLGAEDLCFVATIAGASERLESHGADLVLADFAAGDVLDENGFEQVVASAGDTPVVALDSRISTLHVRRARLAGARAYITKTSTPELMGAAIALVMAGGEYFPHLPLGPGTGSEARPSGWVRRLSGRQGQVLRLMLEGRTNRDIAEALAISLPTVKLHVQAVLRAAGARNRTEAVLWAREPQPPV